MLTQRLALIASTALLFACTPAEPSPKEANEANEAKEANEANGAASKKSTREAPSTKTEAVAAKPVKPAKTFTVPQKKPQQPLRTFRKGQTAPKGLSLEEVYAYNKAQGDPIDGEFTLKMAFDGDEALQNRDGGKLYAVFQTTMGDFACILFEDKAPKTVASFVGLARGKRPWYDKKSDSWQTTPFYDGVIFHRVIKNFMIQTGDRKGTGTGFPGFLLPDEIDPSLTHNKGGILSMANRGPNTGSSQFFVTVRKTPHLNGKHTVFGQCEPKVPVKISEVKVKSLPGIDSRPLDDIKIKTIKIERRGK